VTYSGRGYLNFDGQNLSEEESFSQKITKITKELQVFLEYKGLLPAQPLRLDILIDDVLRATENYLHISRAQSGGSKSLIWPSLARHPFLFVLYVQTTS
jgi:hypothetical protein